MSDSYGSSDYSRNNDDFNRSSGMGGGFNGGDDSYGSARQDRSNMGSSDFMSSRGDRDQGTMNDSDFSRSRGSDSDGFGSSRGDDGYTRSSNADSFSSGGSGYDQSRDREPSQRGSGMGVSGGYEGSQQSQTGEKQDWLDKGIESIGSKVGFNVVGVSYV